MLAIITSSSMSVKAVDREAEIRRGLMKRLSNQRAPIGGCGSTVSLNGSAAHWSVTRRPQSPGKNESARRAAEWMPRNRRILPVDHFPPPPTGSTAPSASYPKPTAPRIAGPPIGETAEHIGYPPEGGMVSKDASDSAGPRAASTR